jgi:hypothetical protein
MLVGSAVASGDNRLSVGSLTNTVEHLGNVAIAFGTATFIAMASSSNGDRPHASAATRPPKSTVPAENAVAQATGHSTSSADQPLEPAKFEAALPKVDRHAPPRTGRARKNPARYFTHHRFSFSLLAFTALTTLAFFETVRAQSPWSSKAPPTAVAAFATKVPAPAILQPANPSETMAEPSVPVRAQNNPDSLAAAADGQETHTPVTASATPASLAPVESAGDTAPLRLTATPIRFESTPANNPSPSAVSPASLATFPNGLPECMASRSELTRLTPMEVGSLIRAGRQLLARGDIDAARIALSRAALSCDTDANYLMGTSFDPRLLTSAASAADVGMARSWFERARNLGSAEAADELARLRKRP